MYYMCADTSLRYTDSAIMPYVIRCMLYAGVMWPIMMV